jgi:hypothetical protein
MGVALAAIAAGVVWFRRATVRADAPGRESACAAVACAGLLAMCGACLEFEKQAAWSGHESRVEDWRSEVSMYSGISIEFEQVLNALRSVEVAVTEQDGPSIEATSDADLVVVPAEVSPLEDSESPVDLVEAIRGSLVTFHSRNPRQLTVRLLRPTVHSFWPYPLDPPPPEPDLRRPVPTPFAWIALAAGFFAVLFGEFHLRGRRLLRDPATGEAIPAAP